MMRHARNCQSRRAEFESEGAAVGGGDGTPTLVTGRAKRIALLLTWMVTFLVATVAQAQPVVSAVAQDPPNVVPIPGEGQPNATYSFTISAPDGSVPDGSGLIGFGLSIRVRLNGTIMPPGSEGITPQGDCPNADPLFPNWFICTDIWEASIPFGTQSPSYRIELPPGESIVNFDVIWQYVPSDGSSDGTISRSVGTFVGNAPPSLGLLPDLNT